MNSAQVNSMHNELLERLNPTGSIDDSVRNLDLENPAAILPNASTSFTDDDYSTVQAKEDDRQQVGHGEEEAEQPLHFSQIRGKFVSSQFLRKWEKNMPKQKIGEMNIKNQLKGKEKGK